MALTLKILLILAAVVGGALTLLTLVGPRGSKEPGVGEFVQQLLRQCLLDRPVALKPRVSVHTKGQS